MGVLAIWRYPVKAMLGELLDAVAIGPRGCEGDRRVDRRRRGDRASGSRTSAARPIRGCARCRAELLARRRAARDRCRTARRRVATASSARCRSCSSRRVALRAAARGRRDLRRPRRPSGLRPDPPHHDRHARRTCAPLAPESLGRPALPPEPRPRRRRPTASAFSRGRAPGRRASQAASGLEMTVGLPTPRCVVPTRAQEELPADPRHPADARRRPPDRPRPLRRPADAPAPTPRSRAPGA